MYLAEIKGKISSKLKHAEDLLTSNVFSFFKYANRTIYLNDLLNMLEIRCTQQELEEAEFHFWPRYQDGTEPDLVLITQHYYILFEAKYLADFGDEYLERKAQLQREYDMGIMEAANLNKQFILVAVTADYNYPEEKFKEVPNIVNSLYFRWINWQGIAALLMLKLLQPSDPLPERLFAQDLLELLDKKNLRKFITFQYLSFPYKAPNKIFFSYETADYRGDFIGFSRSIMGVPDIIKQDNIFYKKQFFSNIPIVNNLDINNKPIFFRRKELCK